MHGVSSSRKAASPSTSETSDRVREFQATAYRRQARLAAFGDSDFISNGFLRHQGNRDLFMRTLAWLMGEREATIVAVAPHENRRLTMTASTGVWMYLVNIGLAPLIPLGAGVVMYLRRRR